MSHTRRRTRQRLVSACTPLHSRCPDRRWYCPRRTVRTWPRLSHRSCTPSRRGASVVPPKRRSLGFFTIPSVLSRYVDILFFVFCFFYGRAHAAEVRAERTKSTASVAKGTRHDVFTADGFCRPPVRLRRYTNAHSHTILVPLLLPTACPLAPRRPPPVADNQRTQPRCSKVTVSIQRSSQLLCPRPRREEGNPSPPKVHVCNDNQSSQQKDYEKRNDITVRAQPRTTNVWWCLFHVRSSRPPATPLLTCSSRE